MDMDRSNVPNNSKVTSPAIILNVQNSVFQVEVQERLPSSNIHSKVQESRSRIQATTVAGQFVQGLFKWLFLVHLFLIFVLVIVLTIRGLVYADSHHFHPRKWYPALLSTTACSGIVAFLWQWITVNSPSRAIRAAFWISPLLTCAVGILLVLIGSPASLGIGVVSVIFALVQSLYACWVNPRFDYAIRVLSASTAVPPGKTVSLVLLSIAVSVFYATFLVTGIGGATSTGTSLDVLFIFIILLSLQWSMQVIRNAMQVTIARVVFLDFACGADLDTRVAFHDTIKYLMGSVCFGSIIVPLITVIRGSSRTVSLFAGGTDEFLFSFADCYSAIASKLMTCANRWGFVEVGVQKKGFVQASIDTWEMLKNAGLETLINTDLTGALCFLCGIAAGSICTLIAGTWTLVIHKSYATEISIYAFLIGYFMTRVAMARPQACVSAYYVAYAENRQDLHFEPRIREHPHFDSTIPDRLQELLRNQAA